MRPKLFALIAVSAVALVGCASGEATSEPSKKLTTVESTAPASSTEAEIMESDVNAKALTMEVTPTETTAPEPVEAQKNKSYAEQTADFISFINPEFSGWAGDLPPEPELIAAAKLVCKQLSDGVPYERVEAIQGSVYKFTKEQEEKLNPAEKHALMQTPLYNNNMKLVNAASSAYCLELRLP